MKKLVVFTVLLCCGTAGFYCTGDDNNLSSTHAVKELYSENLDSFVTAVMKFQQTANERPGQDALQDAFKAARKAYKKVELFAEYYNPATAKAINGPALDEVEADNPEYPEPPHGFQVIEELLFPEYDTAAYAALRSELAALKSVTTRLSMVNETLAFTDSHIFDAVRLELFRIETLALAGFDTPVSFISIEELPVTLQALQTYLTVYKNSGSTKAFDQLSTCFNKASAFLQSNNDFNTFDRALFLVQYMNPLTRQLNIYQEAAGVAYFKEPRPLAPNAATLFDKNVFNPFFYTDTHADTANSHLEVLGKMLFNEKKLSANETRNCAGCHAEEKAFTDGLSKNKSFDGRSVIMRNTPTILYAGLQPALFADLRLVYLEDQAAQVIENPDEMHGNLQKSAQKLSEDSSYKQAFQHAFDTEEITAQKIQKALAAYIRSKNAFSSRFDAYMQGDTAAMNEEEINGFNLFMGKAKCGTCHFMPLFNGTVPPVFLNIESEVLGVPAQKQPPFSLDTDIGRYGVVKSAPYLHAFKTPTVRNAALTAPFMHNGVYSTLEELIDFYNNGGGIGLGLSIDNQTLPPDKLDLSEIEQKQLIAFIKALSDTGY